MKYLVIVLLILSTSCCFEPESQGKSIVIMSWNLQNLFDDEDTGDEYSDFKVEGGQWSSNLYNKRVELLSSIIEFYNPEIVGVQEIEGVSVLEDLAHVLGYPYYFASDSDSAIEVGFLSKYPIVKTGIIGVGDETSGLRDIVEVVVDIEGEELILFNNHWKSKAGGFSEDRRILSAEALKGRLTQLDSREFIILGDLNENYNEEELVSYPTALNFEGGDLGLLLTISESTGGERLFTPWKKSSFQGSYFYKGSWESIDHFLFSPEMMDDKGFIYRSFNVCTNGDLLNEDGSVNKWYSYRGMGYSDHLPILCEIELITDIVTTLE